MTTVPPPVCNSGITLRSPGFIKRNTIVRSVRSDWLTSITKSGHIIEQRLTWSECHAIVVNLGKQVDWNKTIVTITNAGECYMAWPISDGSDGNSRIKILALDVTTYTPEGVINIIEFEYGVSVQRDFISLTGSTSPQVLIRDLPGVSPEKSIVFPAEAGRLFRIVAEGSNASTWWMGDRIVSVPSAGTVMLELGEAVTGGSPYDYPIQILTRD